MRWCSSFGVLCIGSLGYVLSPQTARADFVPGVLSPNWAGVQERSPNANFTRVGAIYTVPNSTVCHSTTDRVAIWVGLNTEDRSIEQTGITVRCDSGYPTYIAWVQMLPGQVQYQNYPVYPGDNMISTVANNGDGTYTLGVWDYSQNWSFSVTQHDWYEDTVTSGAEVIVELPEVNGSYATAPNFGSIQLLALDGDVTSLDGTGPSGSHIVFRSPQPGDYPIYLWNIGDGNGGCCRAVTDGITYDSSNPFSPYTHVHYTGP